MTRTNMWSDKWVRGSHGLSGRRARRKKLRCPKGKKAARRAVNQKSGPNGPLDFQFIIFFLKHIHETSSIKVSGTHRTHGDELVTVVHHRNQEVEEDDDVDQGKASKHDQAPEPEYRGYIFIVVLLRFLLQFIFAFCVISTNMLVYQIGQSSRLQFLAPF